MSLALAHVITIIFGCGRVCRNAQLTWRPDWLSFVEDGRASMQKRSINSIRMRDHPSDIRCGEKHIPGFCSMGELFSTIDKSHISPNPCSRATQVGRTHRSRKISTWTISTPSRSHRCRELYPKETHDTHAQKGFCRSSTLLFQHVHFIARQSLTLGKPVVPDVYSV